LEAVAGDLPDVDVEPDPKVTRREDGALLIQASMPISDVVALLGLRDRQQGDFVTLAGFALHQLHHVPQPTEQFTWCGWRFRVVAMDGSRINKLLAERVD
jgi:putative hemolysin